MSDPRQPSFVARRPPPGPISTSDASLPCPPGTLGGLSRRDLLGYVGRLAVIGGGVAVAAPLISRTPALADPLDFPTLEPSYFEPMPPAPLVVTPAEVPAIEGPALARRGNQVFIAWTDPDHEIHVQRVNNPGPLSETGTKVDQRSAHAPALVFVGNALFLAWTGTDEDSSLNLARLTTNTTTPDITGSVRTLDETSPYGPALAAGPNRLWLAWTGSNEDRTLNVQPFSSSTLADLDDKTELDDETSSGAPALASDGETLYLVWAGTDEEHTLNLAKTKTPGSAGSFDKTTFDKETSDVGAALADSGSLILAWTGTDQFSLLNTAEPLVKDPFKNVYNESASGPPAVLGLPGGRLALAWVNTLEQLTWGRTATGTITL